MLGGVGGDGSVGGWGSKLLPMSFARFATAHLLGWPIKELEAMDAIFQVCGDIQKIVFVIYDCKSRFFIRPKVMSYFPISF